MPHKQEVVNCLSSVPVTFMLECVLKRDLKKQTKKQTTTTKNPEDKELKEEK